MNEWINPGAAHIRIRVQVASTIEFWSGCTAFKAPIFQIVPQRIGPGFKYVRIILPIPIVVEVTRVLD
jgi:hypothetical protein